MKKGTVFFITGGAGGIGTATARLVVEQGGRVAVCDIQEAAAKAIGRDLGDNALPVRLDVRRPGDWDQATEKVLRAFGRIDVLVNNAGVAHGGAGHTLSLEKHQQMVEVNLLGVINGIHSIVPLFLGQGSGHVVNVASFAAFSPVPGLGCYSATKHAVRAFTHSCALDLAASPVGFTLVCPSAVETPMLEQLGKDESAVLIFTEAPISPSEVAAAVVRGALEKPSEILLPPGKGAFLRFFGLFPGLLRRTMPSARKRGVDTLRKRKAGR